MRILLLSAYDAESHRYWRKGLVENLSEHEWTVLTLAGRYFSWRMRGNSLSWAFGQREVLEATYDLVIATSMTDLSALRGFIPSLAQTPTLVYFHENQFAYPNSGKEFKSVEPRILNLYTALAADYCVFNSKFNRSSMLEGARQLLKKMPDQVPSGLIERLESRSSVIPVPLANYINTDHQSEDTNVVTHVRSLSEGSPILITWAARWEYDKGPDLLLRTLQLLEQRKINYQLCIMGQRFNQVPEAFAQIEREFSHRILQFGYADTKAEYLGWLDRTHLFLSTANHEFQGIAVLEAVARGAVPVLPNRLAYPELFNEEGLYTSFDGSLEREAESAVGKIETLYSMFQRGSLTAPDISCFTWKVLGDQYRRIINQITIRGT